MSEHTAIQWADRRVQRIRWRLSDWLSRLACALRGHPWYVADAWHGVPGNRVSELHSQIRDFLIIKTDFQDTNSLDNLVAAEEKLDELAQLAGENWGHVWPKESRKPLLQS